MNPDLRPTEAWFTEPCRAYFSRGKQTTFNFRITLKRNVQSSNNRGTTRKNVVIIPLFFIITILNVFGGNLNVTRANINVERFFLRPINVLPR